MVVVAAAIMLVVSFLAGLNPTAVLVALAAAAVLYLAARRYDLALLVLLGTSALESAVQISTNPQFTVVKVAGAVTFVSFAIAAVVQGRKLRFDETHTLLVLLLALAMISTLQARAPERAVPVTVRYASFVALYFVLTQFGGDYRFLRRAAWVLSASSALAAVLAVGNFFNKTFTQAAPRYGDANDLAFILATTVPLTFWLLGSRWTSRVAAVVLIGLIGAGITLSFSRGALLGLAAGLVWHGLNHRRHLPVLLVGALIALTIAVVFIRPHRERISLGLTSKSRVADANVNARLDAWSAAIRLAVEHPWFGIGPGNFADRYFEATDTPPTGKGNINVVHDAYLDITTELGFPGLLLFLAYLLISFRRLTVCVREGLGPPGLAAALRTALVIAVVASLTLSEQYYAPLWLLGGLGTVLYSESEGLRDFAAT